MKAFGGADNVLGGDGLEGAGGGSDTVVADAIDVVQGNCETVRRP